MWLLCQWMTTTVVWGSFGCHFVRCLWTKIYFWSRNHAQVMPWQKTYCSNHITNALRWCFTYRERLNSGFMANDYGYQELQFVISYFAHILIAKEAMEFTATAPASKLEVPQHVPVAGILFWRCRFFTLETLFFSSLFCTLCIFSYNLQKHTPIKRKLGTRVGLIKAHLRTSFGWNPIKIYRVIIDFFA